MSNEQIYRLGHVAGEVETGHCLNAATNVAPPIAPSPTAQVHHAVAERLRAAGLVFRGFRRLRADAKGTSDRRVVGAEPHRWRVGDQSTVRARGDWYPLVSQAGKP